MKCIGGLCDTLQKMKTEGYFTHKSIAGKYARYVSDKDTQYYCKNSDNSKEIVSDTNFTGYIN